MNTQVRYVNDYTERVFPYWMRSIAVDPSAGFEPPYSVTVSPGTMVSSIRVYDESAGTCWCEHADQKNLWPYYKSILVDWAFEVWNAHDDVFMDVLAKGDNVLKNWRKKQSEDLTVDEIASSFVPFQIPYISFIKGIAQRLATNLYERNKTYLKSSFGFGPDNIDFSQKDNGIIRGQSGSWHVLIEPTWMKMNPSAWVFIDSDRGNMLMLNGERERWFSKVACMVDMFVKNTVFPPLSAFLDNSDAGWLFLEFAGDPLWVSDEGWKELFSMAANMSEKLMMGTLNNVTMTFKI